MGPGKSAPTKIKLQNQIPQSEVLPTYIIFSSFIPCFYDILCSGPGTLLCIPINNCKGSWHHLDIKTPDLGHLDVQVTLNTPTESTEMERGP